MTHLSLVLLYKEISGFDVLRVAVEAHLNISAGIGHVLVKPDEKYAVQTRVP